MIPFINLLFIQALSQPLLGNYHDTHDCLISSGYSWCDANKQCQRQWETPCSDNYSDCEDCLMKQRDGMNIACPDECSMVTIEPYTPHACSDVMCMMYCENGFQQDKNGCNICECSEPLHPIDPVVDPMPPVIDPMPPAVDPMPPVVDPMPPVVNPFLTDNSNECPITQRECSDIVCPKITEITHCSEGGIEGYTTYQLSIIINDDDIYNLYAIYGSDNVNMFLPSAYQVDGPFGSSLGGINERLIAVNENSRYDSWLTIGIINGDENNILNTVGIDFNQWTDHSSLTIDNGAIFLMDPNTNLITNNEIIVGQITTLNQRRDRVILNLQGKYIKNNKDTWKQENIIFNLEKPIRNNNLQTCSIWYDGCNRCQVNNGIIGSCTRMMCFRQEEPYCIQSIAGH